MCIVPKSLIAAKYFWKLCEICTWTSHCSDQRKCALATVLLTLKEKQKLQRKWLSSSMFCTKIANKSCSSRCMLHRSFTLYLKKGCTKISHSILPVPNWRRFWMNVLAQTHKNVHLYVKTGTSLDFAGDTCTILVDIVE